MTSSTSTPPPSRSTPTSIPSSVSTSIPTLPRSPITHRLHIIRDARLPLSRRNPALHSKLQHLRSTLSPLVSINTGTTHPSFPLTLLGFWLLSSAQLDDLAHHYHQRTPGPYSQHYPCPVYRSWDPEASLEEKRRRLSRFIGLRGCESPVVRGDMWTKEEIERQVREERERRAEREEFEGRKGRWC